jgi:hypothetical protein
MRLLVADLLHRNRRRAAFFLPLLALMFGLSIWMGQPAGAFAVTMGGAALLGPQLTLRFVARSIWYLPVSRRHIWRAGWLVATVGTTLALTAVKLIVMVVLLLVPPLDELGAPVVLMFGAVGLSGLYDFAVSGVGCALVIFVTRPQPTGPLRHVSAFFRGLAEFAIQLGFFAGGFGGHLLENRLPTNWNELTFTSLLFLAAALALTVATYFHSPHPAQLARAPQDAGAVRRPARTAKPAGGLSGLPRLLAHEYRWAMGIGAGLSVASVLIVMGLAGVVNAREALVDVFRAELRFLDGVAAAPSVRSRWLAAFGALTWYGFFAGSLAARFPSMLRHLRVLPIGARQMNLLLVCWPAAVWVTAGMVLMMGRYLVLGEMLTVANVALLLALAGLSAVACSLTLRITGLSRILLLPMTLGAVPLLHLFQLPPPSTLALAGIGGLAAAAALNHLTLRRSATYRISHPELAAAAARVGL